MSPEKLTTSIALRILKDNARHVSRDLLFDYATNAMLGQLYLVRSVERMIRIKLIAEKKHSTGPIR